MSVDFVMQIALEIGAEIMSDLIYVVAVAFMAWVIWESEGDNGSK